MQDFVYDYCESMSNKFSYPSSHMAISGDNVLYIFHFMLHHVDI